MTEVQSTSAKDLQIEESEKNQEYNLNLVFNQQKFAEIQKTKFSGKEQLINQPGILSKLSNLLNPRKHLIYISIRTKERSCKINNTQKQNSLKLLTSEDINTIMNKASEKEKNELKYVHIGGIEVIIQAHFREGIDSPIEIIIRDKQIRNLEESILGKIMGNLCYQKIKFCVYPQFNVSMFDKNINDVITLEYVFYRHDLMYQGNHPININYVVGLALSNNSQTGIHSTKPHVSVERMFENITRIEHPHKEFIEEIDDRLPLRSDSMRLTVPRSVQSLEEEKIIPIQRHFNQEPIILDNQGVIHTPIQNQLTQSVTDNLIISRIVTGHTDQISVSSSGTNSLTNDEIIQEMNELNQNMLTIKHAIS
ncbi:uncharacterized protein LOC142521795 [Primulina tabacum]|uniref:uncharacterized protein LOC142521795 n=1 Tax=Primulina tabacum TaxID=48773 RepID=UPI003F59A2E3